MIAPTPRKKDRYVARHSHLKVLRILPGFFLGDGDAAGAEAYDLANWRETGPTAAETAAGDGRTGRVVE